MWCISLTFRYTFGKDVSIIDTHGGGTGVYIQTIDVHISTRLSKYAMGLLPDTQNCGLCMRWECWERVPRHHRTSNPDLYHGTCVTHVPFCMLGSLSCGFLCSRGVGWGRGAFTAFSANAQPAILRIWQEVNAGGCTPTSTQHAVIQDHMNYVLPDRTRLIDNSGCRLIQ